MKALLISFSGGRTSAFMAKFLIEHYANSGRDIVVCFANTGKEENETLDFVNECDKRWGLNTVWLEAKVIPEKGKGTEFNIVTYETASRNGEPFEDVIKKYGIPNKNFPHCTRELKQIPIRKYMYSLGFKDWDTAVGIRADEPHRLNRGSDSNFMNPVFPLSDMVKVDEEFIRNFWKRQEFDLKLKDYESNCDVCHKKSKRKRLTIINENPDKAKWWADMERLYGDGYKFDQRDGHTIEDLVEMAQKPFTKAVDKYQLSQDQPALFEPEWDIEFNCFCKSS